MSLTEIETIQNAKNGNSSNVKLIGLEPYVPSTAQPWNEQRIAHLLRRTGFGAKQEDLEKYRFVSPQDAVNEIVNDAIRAYQPNVPSWHNTPRPPRGSTQAEISAFNSLNAQWRREYEAAWLAYQSALGLREKMTLFWSNHFVTESRVYFYATYASRYLTLFRKHALGDFKKLLYEIGLTPAMLVYLNGQQNLATSPNENYARELFELFTMGIGNYTQTDIKEAARALTGWRTDPYTLTVYFTQSRFDGEDKTIFGQSGLWGYDELINLIFQERGHAVAKFICRKLYQFFVYNEPDDSIVDGLATIFYNSNFNIKPVLQTLFASNHFFDEAIIGARIKSPVEYMLGLINETDFYIELKGYYDFVRRYAITLGQDLFDPPNVAGWPEHHVWLSASTLSYRWYVAQQFIFRNRSDFTLDVIALAKKMAHPNDPYELAFDLANRLFAIPFDISEKEALGAKLLDGMPYYEWNIEISGAKMRLQNYLLYLFRLPEYQLT